jgi:hypothetical protein
MKQDEIKQCFVKIQESIATMNHNSSTTAEAMTRIADAIDKIQDGIASGFSVVNNEHKNIKDNYDITKLLFKWVLFPLIIILGGLVGIKLYFP